MPNAEGKPTLGDLIDEIADDIERADLDRQIEIAIGRAIRHYQPERFFFSERILTFETLAGTDVYFGGDAPDIPDLLAIDSLVRIENDQTYPLTRISESTIERRDDPASASQPCAYSYFDRSIRLWPMPSATWTIRLAAHVLVPAPSQRDETSPWVDEASDLIAARAKQHLGLNSLRDPAFATAQGLLVSDAFRSLRGRSNRIASTGQIRAYHL